MEVSLTVETLSITDEWNLDEVQTQPNTNTKLYHTLSLEKSSIVLVDQRDKFYQMLQQLIVQSVIAFDAEWKPICCATAEVALIQLATGEKIYLIDVITIDLGADDWNKLAQHLFNNVEILKIGIQQRLINNFFLSAINFTALLNCRLFTSGRFKNVSAYHAVHCINLTNINFLFRSTNILAGAYESTRFSFSISRFVTC